LYPFDFTLARRQMNVASQVCELCGAPATLVHHKDQNTYNNAPENLMCLCHKCHRHVHPRKCGRKAATD
jgi:hypothetical protein